MSKHLKLGTLILVLCSTLASQTVLAQVQPAPAPTSPNVDVDTRLGIVTLPWERALILRNMRKYLAGLQELTAAVANGDMKTATEAARSMGSVNLYDIKLKFASKTAIEFREIAFEVHKDFDRAAADAEAKKDGMLLLKQVSTIMKRCTYCHETFHLQQSAH